MLRRDLAGIRGQVHLERCVRVVWVILGGVVEVFLIFIFIRVRVPCCCCC